MAGMQSGDNFSHAALANNQLAGFSYDAEGNTTNDGVNSYIYNADNQIVSAAGVNYTYDGDGDRVGKSSGRLYWYGSSGILAESDLTGNLTAEYVFFGGERIARRDLPSGPVHYYFSDHLKSVGVVTSSAGVIEEESDYHPWGEEQSITHSLAGQHYKFNGKERDPETGFDEFGARLYASAFGRWLTPDWSADPTPVPYAHFDNPQTLNLYAYVADNPTSFPDLDGHQTVSGLGNPDPVSGPLGEIYNIGFCINEQIAKPTQGAGTDQTQNQPQQPELMVTPNKEADLKYGGRAREQIVDYTVVSQDSNGKITPVSDPHQLELNEALDKGNAKKISYCDSAGKCAVRDVTPDNPMKDQMAVTSDAGSHTVTKRFQIDGHPARIYDPASGNAYNFVKVDASVKKGFVFNYGNDPH